MDEWFEIPVLYKKARVAFPARLLQSGYTHRFVVDVNGQEIFFEPDEEQAYRALLDPEQMPDSKPVDLELLKAIAMAIEAILK